MEQKSQKLLPGAWDDFAMNKRFTKHVSRRHEKALVSPVKTYLLSMCRQRATNCRASRTTSLFLRIADGSM